MQTNGWIKLHRKILQNTQLQNDHTAKLLFIDLLLIANQNGQWAGGRFQLSAICKIKPVTLYKALKRLEKYKMVTLSSNNKFTTISICNWSSYQAVSNTKREQLGNNKVTSGEHSYKNKEIRIKKKPVADLNGTGYKKARKLADQLRAKNEAKTTP